MHSQPNSGVVDVAIDEDDKVYVLSREKELDYTLSVYSADGGNTHHCTLEFLEDKIDTRMYINVNKDKNIVIGFKGHANIEVYLCNSKGELINSFDKHLKDDCLLYVSVSCNNEITLMTRTQNGYLKDSNVLYIYTENGQLQRTVKFHPSEGRDTYNRLFYNQVTRKIIGQVYDRHDRKTLIECLSVQTAERECSYLLYGTNFPDLTWCFDLLCHSTNGALCWVGKKHVIFLQKPR